MGIGQSKGENRAIEAAKSAVASPLLELSIEGAKGILFTIAGSSNLSMNEVNEAAKIITGSADPDAKIIFGAIISEDLDDDIKITVVATGFEKGKKAETLSQISSYKPTRFISRTRDEEPNETEDAEDDKTRIFGRKKVADQPTAAKVEEDDELDIPAFIRKKMK